MCGMYRLWVGLGCPELLYKGAEARKASENVQALSLLAGDYFILGKIWAKMV